MRPSIENTMLEVATVLARRATCAKLKVGCVVTDYLGRILATGYNGVPTGFPHCTDEPCSGAKAPKGSDTCEAVHAEQNALLQTRDPQQIHTVYVTHAPCLRCTKMLLNTTARSIVFLNDNNEEVLARLLWEKGERQWRNYSTELEVPPWEA